jgi:hypothetical protein
MVDLLSDIWSNGKGIGLEYPTIQRSVSASNLYLNNLHLPRLTVMLLVYLTSTWKILSSGIHVTIKRYYYYSRK